MLRCVSSLVFPCSTEREFGGRGLVTDDFAVVNASSDNAGRLPIKGLYGEM
jgi:hypothetical protein